MTSKRTDPFSKTSTLKNQNPNPNPNQSPEKKHKNRNPNPNPNNQSPEKKHKNKNPNPNPNRSPSPSEEKKSKKKKSRSSTENPNPKTPIPLTPKKEMSSAPDSAASKKRKADEDDAITILEAVIDFQAENGGANPTPTNMRPLFDSLKNSLHTDLTSLDQLYNRIRHLRQKYHRLKETSGGPSNNSLYDEKFYKLSVRAWGDKPTVANGSSNSNKKLKPTPVTPAPAPAPAPARENGDDIKDHDKDGDEEMEEAAEEAAGESFKFLTHQAREYWAMAGLPVDTLELGLKSMDRNKAKSLEKKWAQHLEAALKVQAKEFEIGKELYLALIAAQKAAAN